VLHDLPDVVIWLPSRSPNYKPVTKLWVYNPYRKPNYRHNESIYIYIYIYKWWISCCAWTDELCCSVKVFILCCISLLYIEYHL